MTDIDGAPPEIIPQLSFTIETAQPEDAEQVRGIQISTWIATYPNPDFGISENYIRQRLEGENGSDIPRKIERWRTAIESADKTHRVYVARSGDSVLGFVAPRSDNGQRRLGAIYVLPEVQGKGIGSSLLKKAIDFHGRDQDIHLTAVAYNTKALDFYRHHGFIVTGKVEEEDGEPLPLVKMVLAATGSKESGA